MAFCLLVAWFNWIIAIEQLRWVRVCRRCRDRRPSFSLENAGRVVHFTPIFISQTKMICFLFFFSMALSSKRRPPTSLFVVTNRTRAHTHMRWWKKNRREALKGTHPSSITCCVHSKQVLTAEIANSSSHIHLFRIHTCSLRTLPENR